MTARELTTLETPGAGCAVCHHDPSHCAPAGHAHANATHDTSKNKKREAHCGAAIFVTAFIVDGMVRIS
jgi:hypothetical protein